VAQLPCTSVPVISTGLNHQCASHQQQQQQPVDWCVIAHMQHAHGEKQQDSSCYVWLDVLLSMGTEVAACGLAFM
jgi:hypothetical protein